MSKLIPFTTGWFESFDKTKIYYEIHGKGEPLVLVYGIACLLNHWHYQIEYFSKKYQVICFDLRGHHNSETPADKKNLSLTAVAKDLPYLLRSLGLKKAHFVGHSFGAPILLNAYSLSPGIFESLCFINGFSKNPIKGMFGLDVVEPFFHFVKTQFEKSPILWNALWRTTVDNPISMWASALAGGFNIRMTEFKDIEIYAKGVSQIPLDVFIPLFEDMMGFDGDEVAQSIDKPVLIISGERDFVTPQKFQHQLHATIKNSELFTIPYGSHCCQLDFPDFINLKLEQFLEEGQEPPIS
jgi:pimeloyl-ACP methyl ester carboxylesterase